MIWRMGRLSTLFQHASFLVLTTQLPTAQDLQNKTLLHREVSCEHELPLSSFYAPSLEFRGKAVGVTCHLG
jgi:hypothetical protein